METHYHDPRFSTQEARGTQNNLLQYITNREFTFKPFESYSFIQFQFKATSHYSLQPQQLSTNRGIVVLNFEGKDEKPVDYQKLIDRLNLEGYQVYTYNSYCQNDFPTIFEKVDNLLAFINVVKQQSPELPIFAIGLNPKNNEVVLRACRSNPNDFAGAITCWPQPPSSYHHSMIGTFTGFFRDCINKAQNYLESLQFPLPEENHDALPELKLISRLLANKDLASQTNPDLVFNSLTSWLGKYAKEDDTLLDEYFVVERGSNSINRQFDARRARSSGLEEKESEYSSSDENELRTILIR